jgi:hypothetical protein
VRRHHCLAGAVEGGDAAGGEEIGFRFEKITSRKDAKAQRKAQYLSSKFKVQSSRLTA